MTGPKNVTVFTDGACIGNPGPGGYGAVLRYRDHRRELSAGYRRTTNNRMELTAVIKALAALREPCVVDLHSDSEYVVNAMTERWAQRWRANGWRRDRTKIAVNWDLWQELLDLCDKHRVSFHWVKGHAGHRENERCDQLAVKAAQGPDLPPDVGYESPTLPPLREAAASGRGRGEQGRGEPASSAQDRH